MLSINEDITYVKHLVIYTITLYIMLLFIMIT